MILDKEHHGLVRAEKKHAKDAGGLLVKKVQIYKEVNLKSLPPFPNARGHNSSRNVRSSQCIIRRIDTRLDLVGALSLHVTYEGVSHRPTSTGRMNLPVCLHL
jgi:hypothetical protein